MTEQKVEKDIADDDEGGVSPEIMSGRLSGLSGHDLRVTFIPQLTPSASTGGAFLSFYAEILKSPDDLLFSGKLTASAILSLLDSSLFVFEKFSEFLKLHDMNMLLFEDDIESFSEIIEEMPARAEAMRVLLGKMKAISPEG